MNVLFFMKIGIINFLRIVLRIFYIFPIKDNYFFFESFNGKGYNDNPQYISEYLSNRHKQYRQIWSFRNNIFKTVVTPTNIKKVKTGSLLYMYHIMTSRVIVTNDFFSPIIPIRKSQILVNTWHGGGFFKKVAMTSKLPSRYMEWYYHKQNQMISAFVASSQYFIKTVVRDSFLFTGDTIHCGMPRNSVFFKELPNVKERLRNYFGVPFEDNSLLVLFAPTFRGCSEQGVLNMSDENLDVKKVHEAFEVNYRTKVYFLYRAHHAIVNDKLSGNYLDATAYPDMQDLLYCSDILISDYSSCMWDFGLMNKPIFVYAPDLQYYENSTGFFKDVNEWPYPIGRNNKELLDSILSFDYGDFINRNTKCMAELVSYENANATDLCVEWIFNRKQTV